MHTSPAHLRIRTPTRVNLGSIPTLLEVRCTLPHPRPLDRAPGGEPPPAAPAGRRSSLPRLRERVGPFLQVVGLELVELGEPPR